MDTLAEGVVVMVVRGDTLPEAHPEKDPEPEPPAFEALPHPL